MVTNIWPKHTLEQHSFKNSQRILVKMSTFTVPRYYTCWNKTSFNYEREHIMNETAKLRVFRASRAFASSAPSRLKYLCTLRALRALTFTRLI